MSTVKNGDERKLVAYVHACRLQQPRRQCTVMCDSTGIGNSHHGNLRSLKENGGEEGSKKGTKWCNEINELSLSNIAIAI